MDEGDRYNSDYANYVDAAQRAHVPKLLRFALSGWVTRDGKLIRQSEEEAKDSVQDALVRLLSAIKNRNPTVMELVMDYAPESDNVRYMLLHMLKCSVVETLRRNGRYVSEADIEFYGHSEGDEGDDPGAIEWLGRQTEPPWHSLPQDAETILVQQESTAARLLLEIRDGAVSAGEIDEIDQKVFDLMVREAKGEVTDYEAAAELRVSRKRYQNLKSEVKGKLRGFLLAHQGGKHD